MKELRRNMRIVATLVIVAFVGLSGWFAFTVFEQGSIWASNSYNTRLGSSKVRRGDIIDRSGVTVATTDSSGKRVYLENTSARRAMAVTLGDTAGMSGTGVEGYFSSTLLDLSDSLLERLAALFNGTERKGSTIELTVDAELTAYISKHFPEGYRGAVCVMNYKTGEILSMVSLPNYDPDSVGEDIVEDTAYLNRCLQGLYAPGSVFKIVTLVSALEADPSVADQTFICSGTWEYENGSIVCAGKTAHGQVSLKTAFAKSCNVTFGKLAYQLGLERLRATAEKLGFNQNYKLGDFAVYNSQFPTTTSGISDLVWAGIGQGTVLTTPMNVAMITSTVANGGEMMKPYLVKRVTTSSGTVTRAGSAQSMGRMMTETTANTVAEYMYETVQNGTAKSAAIKGYTVCGKTGSAETSNDKSVETNSWYTGFIADSAHPYAIAVVVEQGGSGSGKAAELAQKALKKTIELVG